MSTNNKPITGWVAWHPDTGILEDMGSGMFVAGTYEEALEDLKDDLDLSYSYDESDVESNHGEWLSTQGWRIRPVELRFTDEGEG